MIPLNSEIILKNFYFLRSYVVLQLVRQPVYSTSSDNNQATFHFSWTESMLKHEKLSGILWGIVAQPQIPSIKIFIAPVMRTIYNGIYLRWSSISLTKAL